MKKRVLIHCLILLVSLPTLLFAQQRTVSGRVTDSKDSSPLIDATVTVVGKAISTKTKTDGTFSISVPTGSTQLRVSYVGFADQTIRITSDNVDVSMSASAQSLTDVIVIGYGTSRKKDVTGAVASVKAKDFNQGVIQAPDQLLQNKVAGLEVSNTSGQPGAAQLFRSGVTRRSVQVTTHLFVVDGVPLDGGTARPNLGTTFGARQIQTHYCTSIRTVLHK